MNEETLAQQFALTEAEQTAVRQEVDKFIHVLQTTAHLQLAIDYIRSLAQDEAQITTHSLQRLQHSRTHDLTALTSLQQLLQQLAPPTSSAGLTRRWFDFLTPSPEQRYFQQYQRYEPQLADLLTALRQQSDALLKEQIAWQQEQQQLWLNSQRLAKYRVMADVLAQQLTTKTWLNLDPFSPTVDEVLAVLTRKQADLDQQAVLGLQALLAVKLMMQNNLVLQQQLERVLMTTVTAVRVAVLLAPILSQQTLTLQQLNRYFSGSVHPPQTWADLQQAFNQALVALAEASQQGEAFK